MLVSDYNVDKLNIATLGNVVEQMHIHVVGRYTTDSAWPNPVWGNIESEEYGYDQRSQIVDEITGALGI
jgi:diadenosine tetraphosphate (Ap4A) HIT family hydrolase